MIWIIGGTIEARQLAGRLDGKREFIVTVATDSGAELLHGIQAVVGRMGQREMAAFISQNVIDTIIDVSHPYATEVTKNARAAGEETGARYIRFSRKHSYTEGCVYVRSVEECVSFLEGVKGCVFFTTGIKNIIDFEKARGSNRFIYRVLPTVFSIKECVDRGVRMEDVIAILGPVSEEMNYCMFRDYKADYVIMKDSGREGGTLEKINACKRLFITPVVILRQDEESGIEDMDELLRLLEVQ